MRNEFRKAFEPVRAEDALKERTMAFVQKELARRRPRRPVVLRLAAAACILVFISLLGLNVLYFRVDAYISIDINPSVELGVNLFGRVVSVKGWNDAGQEIAGLVDVSNKTYEEAVKALVSSQELQAYVKKDSLMVLTVAGENEAILQNLEQVETGMQTDFHACPKEDADEAHSSGVSLGRYSIFKAIQELNPDFTAEECMSMSMRALRDMLAQLGGTLAETVRSEENIHEEAAQENTGNRGAHGNSQGNGQGKGTGQGNGNGQGRGGGSGNGLGKGKHKNEN